MHNCSSVDGSTEGILKKTGLSTSFTICFEDEIKSTLRQKKIKAPHKFDRKHTRTLSLPFENFCISEKIASDNVNSVKKNSSRNSKNQNTFINSSSEGLQSDSESEGGTYTLDKDNREVLVARKTIDQVFGISPVELSGKEASDNERTTNKSRMVGEWLQQNSAVFESKNFTRSTTLARTNLKQTAYVSKIPSPVFGHRELNSKNTNNQMANTSICARNDENSRIIKLKTTEHPINLQVNGDIHTENYLKENDKIVAALHNCLQNDVNLGKEIEKESPIKFNRAFSLRRDSLKTLAPALINNTSIPVRSKTFQKNVTSVTNAAQNRNVAVSISRKNNSLKDVKSILSPHISPSKTLKSNELKKSYPRSKATQNGSRSNSSLSAQEIEFQNWKRRKSYDPLKAAARDKKKKSVMQSSAGCTLGSNAALTKKQKSSNRNDNDDITEVGMTRSASFHGLQYKNGYEQQMYSGANNIDYSKNNHFISSSCLSKRRFNSSRTTVSDDGDWIVPKPPSTSLQNTPPDSISSKLSLLSNAMSSSSILLNSPNTKVNLMILLSVTQLTREIHDTVSSITHCFSSENAEGPIGLWSESDDCGNYRFNMNGSLDDNKENSNYLNDNSEESANKIRSFDHDDSESSDLSGDYYLKIALSNLKQIQDAIQKLCLFYKIK